MKKISVAITTYNSSRFIRELLSRLSRNNIINEIIIHDDYSEEKEYENILQSVSSYKNKKKISIKTYRNNSNIGGFKNKYLAVEKCTNSNIYLLDSDNILSNSFSQFFNEDFFEGLNKDYLYLPSHIYLFKKNYLLSSFKKSSLRKIVDEDLILNIETIQKEISNNVICYKPMDWILNLGNWFFNKDSYLDKLKEGYESKNKMFAADGIAASYHWLKNGGSLFLKKDFYHFHRLRPDSYYSSSSTEVSNLSEQYIDLIKKL